MAWICNDCLKNEKDPIVCAVIRRKKKGEELLPVLTEDGRTIEYKNHALHCELCDAKKDELTEVLI